MSSVLKPFITDITTTNTATLEAIPRNEIRVITEKKPSFPFGRRYLFEIHNSNNRFFIIYSIRLIYLIL
tara:strand:- start:367 stop:573 length:207 start_codon:yes stop_codon:yes gene_type:complete